MHLTLRACAFVISIVFAVATVAMTDAGAEEAKQKGKDVAIEAIERFSYSSGSAVRSASASASVSPAGT